MASFQKEKKWPRILYSKYSLVTLGLLTIFFAYNVSGLIRKSHETNKNLAMALSELDTLKAKQASLQSAVDTLSTDQGVEDSIREKYRVVKDGEGLVVITDAPKDTDTGPIDGGVAQEHGFWNFIKGMFEKRPENAKK